MASTGGLGDKNALTTKLEVITGPSNFHTITILLAHIRDPDINPMMMGPGLEQIMDWHCSCKAGLCTAASCTHRNAALILLCATSCYDTAKVQEPVLVDTARFVLFLLTI